MAGPKKRKVSRKRPVVSLKQSPAFRWYVLALIVMALCLIDGVLTLRFEQELNPVLAHIHRLYPPGILFVKLALAPIFYAISRSAARNSPSGLARYGLVFTLGWYTCVVITQVLQLVTLG